MKPDSCVAMNYLLFITIVSIISTGRRVGPPLLIFIMLLWRAPGRRCAVRFLSPWRSWVVISPPWSRWVWSALKKKHNRIKNNKKLKVPQIKAHELLQKSLISAKHTSTEDGPDSEESGNGNETALYGRWEAISISYLNKSKLQTSIFHKKIFIVTGDIILRCYL